jgi:hypothetical protein
LPRGVAAIKKYSFKAKLQDAGTGDGREDAWVVPARTHQSLSAQVFGIEQKPS